MKKNYLIIAFFCLIAISGFTQEQTSQEYRDELKCLLTVSGRADVPELIIDHVIAMTVPDVGAEKIMEIKSKITPKIIDVVIDVLLPLYVEVGMTVEDIKTLSNAYLTDAGKKFVVVEKNLLENGQEAGYGQQMMTKVQELIKEVAN